MKIAKRVTLLTLGALVVGFVWGRPSVAAAPVAGIVGQAQSQVAGCPPIHWRLARHPDGKVTGMFWFGDLSGVSSAVGSIDKAEHFHLTLTSAIGQGPAGDVDGQRSKNGKVVAEIKGEGCSNYKIIRMTPVTDINKYGFIGAGG
jgi:hypothetical protein